MPRSSRQHEPGPELGVADYAVKTWRYLRLALVAVVIGLLAAIVVERAKVHPGCFLTSISAYYYTPVRNYFVGGLIGVSVALICMRGSTQIEDVLLNLAGMLAPIVAFVPTPISTPPPTCSSVPITKTGLEQGVANNVLALLVVGALGLIVALVLILRKDGPRSWQESVGWVVAVVIWSVTALVFALARNFFVHTAHYAAAVPMFGLIVAVAADNAIDYKRQGHGTSLRNRYGAIAIAMVVASVVIGIAGLLGWHHWTILLEGVLIGLVGFFWVIQTVELWKPGLRAQALQPLPTKETHVMTATTGESGRADHGGCNYTAPELILITKADAEGLIDTLDAIKAAPADGKADAIVVLADKMERRGWETRAADLSTALCDNAGGLRPGPQLELAWEIHNDIVDVVTSWSQVDAGRSQDPAAIDAALRPLLTRIVATSTSLTQYEDMKRFLAADLRPIAPGKSLDADAALSKYVTDANTRNELLTKLAADREFVGAVAPAHGLIYKLSDSQGFRVFTYLAPLLFFVLAGGALIGISALHSVFGSGYPTQLWGIVAKPHAPAMLSWHKLLGPYLLVIGGVIAHLMAENLKQNQAGVPILAINDLLAWLNLRWVGLAYSFVPVIIVVVGLSVLNVGATGHDLTLWLAAGYSVDSIAGLVLNRFDTGSLAAVQLQKVLTLTKGA